MGVYGGLWISGRLWVLMGGMSVYGYYISTLKILPIFSFKNPRRFKNSKKRLKSHMCYNKWRMRHGGGGLSTRVFSVLVNKVPFLPLGA